MLHITRSTITLKKELPSVQNLLMDIVHILNKVTPETNLSKEVGIFVSKIPEYKVLAKDAADAKQFLRKVCTCEISIPEAIKIAEKAYFEVTALMDALEDFQVTPKNSVL